jgi:hypothetical protein
MRHVAPRPTLRYDVRMLGWLKKGERAIALPFVLLIVALLLITVSTVALQGIGSLRQAKGEQFSKQALFAAEAGACDALRRLVEDPTYSAPLSVTMDLGAEYSFTILNNIAPGSGTQFATNGAEVPEGYAYILSTGSFASATRKTGLLVSPGSTSALGLAIGVGGNADMQGSKRVEGTIKASSDIKMQGSSRITPSQGSGRMLAGGNIDTQGSTTVDAAQDVRARGSINSQPGIRDALTIQSSDTTDSTLPFIADGRTTNALAPGEQGVVLPNPDRNVLLAPIISGVPDPNFVDHTADVGSPPNNFDLGGKTHYYPNGVSFTGVTGQGTIITDAGTPMAFQGSTTINGHLIALRTDPLSNTGTPSISFQGSTSITGLVYAHEDIDIQGSFTLNGVLIAYRNGGGDLTTQGSTRINLDSSVFAGIPGFGSWASGFGGVGGAPVGSGPVSVVSWERM